MISEASKSDVTQAGERCSRPFARPGRRAWRLSPPTSKRSTTRSAFASLRLVRRYTEGEPMSESHESSCDDCARKDRVIEELARALAGRPVVVQPQPPTPVLQPWTPNWPPGTVTCGSGSITSATALKDQVLIN